jgi:hypothetical protein
MIDVLDLLTPAGATSPAWARPASGRAQAAAFCSRSTRPCRSTTSARRPGRSRGCAGTSTGSRTTTWSRSFASRTRSTCRPRGSRTASTSRPGPRTERSSVGQAAGGRLARLPPAGRVHGRPGYGVALRPADPAARADRPGHAGEARPERPGERELLTGAGPMLLFRPRYPIISQPGASPPRPRPPPPPAIVVAFHPRPSSSGLGLGRAASLPESWPARHAGPGPPAARTFRAEAPPAFPGAVRVPRGTVPGSGLVPPAPGRHRRPGAAAAVPRDASSVAPTRPRPCLGDPAGHPAGIARQEPPRPFPGDGRSARGFGPVLDPTVPFRPPLVARRAAPAVPAAGRVAGAGAGWTASRSSRPRPR